MRLTEVARSADITVLRDGDFRNLGFLDDRHESQFVFLESQQFLAALLRSENIRAVLTTPEMAQQIPGHLAVTTSGQPRLTFAPPPNPLAQRDFYCDQFAT